MIVLQEEIFFILYHYKGGINYSDVMKMTINDRKWYINQIKKQMEFEQEQMKIK